MRPSIVLSTMGIYGKPLLLLCLDPRKELVQVVNKLTQGEEFFTEDVLKTRNPLLGHGCLDHKTNCRLYNFVSLAH